MRASPSPLRTKPRLSSANENESPVIPRKLMSQRKSLGGSLNKRVCQGDAKSIDEKGQVTRPSLSDPQLSTLYSECIKLATTNKVNQQNAWSLHLIDYMDEVIMKANDFKDIEVPDDGEESAAVLEALAYDRHIKQAVDGVPRMNFQKASCTLDASVMIYSHRVDSVHKDTFKVLGAFNRGGGEGGGEAAGDNAEAEEKKKKVRQRYVSTIETNLSNLNVKLFDLDSQTDPVFKKTSASFDQGGARGLLLNNLGNYEGCKIAFDSDIVPDGNYDLYCDDAEVTEAKKFKIHREKEAQAASVAASVNIDTTEIWESLGKTLGIEGNEEILKATTSLRICPSLTQFYANLDSLEDDETIPLKKLTVEDDDDDDESENEVDGLSQQLAAELVMGSAEPFEAVEDLDRAIEQEEQIFQAMQGSQFDASGEVEEYEDDESQVQSVLSLAPPTALAARGLASPGVFGGGDELDDSDEEVPDLPLVFSDQKEDLAFIDSTLLKNWAGGSHWKFHGPKGGASRAGGDGKRVKAVFQLDFFDGEEIDESAFAKPGPRSSNCVAKSSLDKADPVKLLLPEDLNISATSISKLFTRPVFVGFRPKTIGAEKNNKRSSLAGAAQQMLPDEDETGLSYEVSQMSFSERQEEGNNNEFHQSFGAEGEEGGGDSDSENDGGHEANTSTFTEFDSKFDLVAQPAMVGKVDIKFAKFAKKVDVRQLKNAMWNGIETKRKTEPKSFQQTMNYLSTALPSSTLQNISVSYCFICLLHLCNEKNLRLIPKDEIEGSTIHEKSPNDIGYSLADFEIRNE